MPSSPTPAPRRRYVAPGTSTRASPAPRQIRIVGNHTASLRGTPNPALEDFNMNVDRASGSPFTERRAEVIFAKTDEFVVTQHANLPFEVATTLNNANFYDEYFHGDVDLGTGFAVVASVETCFVWQYAQALMGTPTCYIFPCPADTVFRNAPFNALVPSGTTREPGLLLLSPSGELRYWDSVSDGLAGASHFTTVQLLLFPHEVVTTFIRSDPQNYVAATSQGRLFRLTLSPSGGRQHIIPRVFGRPQASSLSRFLPVSWTAGSSVMPTETQGANAIALGQRSGSVRDAWALFESRIQRWRILDDGWEDQLLDEEILQLCSDGIRQEFKSAPDDNAELGLELLDLATVNSEQLIILASFSGSEDDVSMDGTRPRRIYAVLYISFTGSSFLIDHITGVPYQSTSSSGAPMHPRLKILSKGALVAIQFGDAVTFCARNSTYLDRIELKSAKDRTLGVGVIEIDGEILVLTSATMLKVILDVEKVSTFNADTGRAKVVKSTMMQAILYGSNPQNPLHFSFPPDISEDSLMAGAEQLSLSVLKSDVELVKPNHDLTAHMAVRKARLTFLMDFINDNGVLGKISQRTRQNLAADGEKLYAANQLWLRHSANLSSDGHAGVLNDAIYAFMSEVSEHQHEDFVRAFFRLHIDHLDGLVPYIMNIVEQANDQQSRADVIPEANNILLTVFVNARKYRETNFGVYGIELPLVSSWTSRPKVIKGITVIFDQTAAIIEAPSDLDITHRGNKQVPLRQLPELASLLFETMHERLDWVKSPLGAEKHALEAETFEEGFNRLRPRVLDELRKNGHLDHAFSLSERYRDFRNLAALCNQDPVWPPKQSIHIERIKAYVQKYGNAFTTELYHWYIQYGELRCLFAQEVPQRAYIDKYFDRFPNPRLSWIHYLGTQDYDKAQVALSTESTNAKELVEKQFMLSIGKLCILSQEGNVAKQQQDLDSIHNQLDFVSVQEKLLESLKSALNPKHKLSADAQLEAICREKASRLEPQPAFLSIFRMQVRRLLKGRTLSYEDIVDVLVLKDNTSIEDRDDYIWALKVLSRSMDFIPAARLEAAHCSVWRRIYLHDDWNAIRQTAGISDHELSDRFRETALYNALRAAARAADFKVLSPAESLNIPTVAELEARWPGTAPDQIEAIGEDHREESEKLASLHLEDVIDRVQELAVQDPVWA